MVYDRCTSCGVFADDGGFKDERFYCHDCLDKKHAKASRLGEELRLTVELSGL